MTINIYLNLYAFYHISANKFLTLYYRIALHVYFFTPYLSQINYKIVTISFLYLLNTSIFLNCCTIVR